MALPKSRQSDPAPATLPCFPPNAPSQAFATSAARAYSAKKHADDCPTDIALYVVHNATDVRRLLVAAFRQSAVRQ
ncbi:hypothetical protein AGMMS49974_11060 [Deltaproteobacteria bacterium]|nr:hypothetical protein AGMMS49974_11060 [Deltaproteobacteria bacterium]